MCKLIDTKPGSIGGGSAICIAALLALSSCAAEDRAKFASTVDDGLRLVAAACAVYQAGAAPFANHPATSEETKARLAYGNSVCLPTGVVNPNVGHDADTAMWVTAITAALNAAKEVTVPVKPPANG